MKIEYSEIKVTKITRKVYQATCNVTKPLKAEMTMTGKTAEIAKEKLKLFLNDEPYKHLDDL